ncbi:MAG TPA: hypothetical protein VGJ33_20925 [Candidatus Angelobacter sp.]
MLLLRWRLFVNSLRRPNRGAELGFQALYTILGSGLVLLLCGAFFGGTYGLLRTGRPDLLDLLLLALFFIWQLAPILFEGYSPGLNFREVARYPISFRTYFLLNLAYGLSDPAALACLFWLFSIWLAVLMVRPDLALSAALAFLLFALFNLLCNRILVGLFERFQSTRKGRERMVLIMLVFLLLPQLLQITARSWASSHALNVPPAVVGALVWARTFLPSGLAAHIFLYTGAEQFQAIAGMILFAGVLLLLLYRQLSAVFQGEIYAETYKVHRELKVRLGLHLPGMDEVTSAIVEKELRYIRQNSRLLLQLIYPPIIFLLLAFYGPGRTMPFTRNPGGLLIGLASFLLLSLSNIAYNIFGMDKEAFGRWLLSPLPLQKIFLAKNLTHGGILSFLYLVVALSLIAVTHVGLLQVATVTVGFFAMLVVQLAAGNLFSLYWPKRVDLTQMTSRMTSSSAGLASLLVVLPLAAIWGLIAFAAWAWQLAWLPLVFGLIILAGSFKLYSYLLDRASAYTFAHIEEITGNLGA